MFEILEHLPYNYFVGLLLQGQFNYVNIKPLDYESNAVVFISVLFCSVYKCVILLQGQFNYVNIVIKPLDY